MSLRRTVVVAVSGTSLLILGLLVHLARSSSTSHALDETRRLSHAMTIKIAVLDQLVFTYMLHPQPGPAQEWHQLSDGMEVMFQELERMGGERVSVVDLRREHLLARQQFDIIMAEAGDTLPDTTAVVLRRSRLAEQMLLVSRSLVNHARTIDAESLLEQSRIQRRDSAITIACLGAAIALLAWLLGYIYRQVLSRLELLRSGAQRAAHGQLEVILGDQRTDEIGLLSRAFDDLLREVRSGRERIRTEAAQRASEERQRQLIDALPGLMWAAQPDGTIDTCNRSWRQQFAVTPDTPGYDWTTLIHPDDLGAWRSSWRAALGDHLGFDSEFRLQRKEGWRWYQSHVAPLLDDQGRVLRWVCKVGDIHEHKELEGRLRTARNQAELLNQIGIDLVGEQDLPRLTQRVTDHIHALVDAEFAVLFYQVADPDNGHSVRHYAVSGLPVEVFAGLGLPQTADRFISAFIEQGVVRCDDVRLDARLGHNASQLCLPIEHLPVVSYLAVPVRTRYGAVLGGLFCGHSQAARFTEQHERLLQGIAAMTATAFDSARLIEAERRLRRVADQRTTDLARSNAELEQFAYICSHDLQEPLRMVSTFLGLLEERYRTQLDERGLGFIHRAVDGSTRMQNLIRDILAFSRVGRGERAEEILALGDVVQEALANLHTAIAQNGAQIQVGELPRVHANRLQCVQLMQNLIGNALKYHGDSPPVISISAIAEGDRWRISVADNGIGIDPIHHQRIFQIFQRLHGRDQFEGTGIGLSLCQKIVLAHGGTIGVESQLGQGARFWFTLPGADAGADRTPPSGERRVIAILGRTTP